MTLRTPAILAIAAISLLSSAVHAGLDTTVSVDRSYNLYYTGVKPKEAVSHTDTSVPEDQRYYGYLIGVVNYPTEVLDDPDTGSRPAGCEVSDLDRSCFGAPAKVIDLAAAGATDLASAQTVYATISNKVKSSSGTEDDAKGKSDDPPFTENRLPHDSLIGLWVNNLNTSFGSLEDYRNNVDTGEILQPGQKQGTVSFISLQSKPGFTAIGEEFELTGNNIKSTAGVYNVSMPRPAGATHLLLAYNTTRGEFSNAANGSFSVKLSDVNPLAGHVGPNATISVSGGGSTQTGTGAFQVKQGQTVTFTGPARTASVLDYSWLVNGEVQSSTDATMTYNFGGLDTYPVILRITDTAYVTDEETIQVTVVENTGGGGSDSGGGALGGLLGLMALFAPAFVRRKMK